MASAATTKTRGGRRLEPKEPLEEQDDDQDDYVRERDEVEAYVAEHALERTLTDLLNDVVADRPADPLLALSALLLARSTASARGILHVQLSPLLVPAFRQQAAPSALVRIHTAKGVFSSACAAMPGDGVEESDATKSDAFVKIKPVDYLALNDAVNEALAGLDPTDQRAIDEALERLTIASDRQNNEAEAAHASLPRHLSLACSLAACQAGAKFAELPLRHHVASLAGHDVGDTSDLPGCVPMPLFSVVNGGADAANKLFAQEVFLAPLSATSFSDALAIGAAFHRSLRKQLDTRGTGFSNVGAFGGFAPQLQSLAEVFQLLRAALDDTRAELSTDVPRSDDDTGIEAKEAAGDPSCPSPASVSPLEVAFGVDFAASEFVLGPVVPPPPAVDPLAEDAPDGATEDSEASPPPQSQPSPPPLSRPTYTYDTDRWVTGSAGTFKVSDEMLEIVRSNISELSLFAVVDPFAAVDVGSMVELVSTIEQDGVNPDVSATGAEAKASSSPQVVARAALYPQYESLALGDAATAKNVTARIEALAMSRACDAVALELRQFATLSQLLEAVSTAQRFGLAVVLCTSAGDCAGDGELLTAIALGAGNVTHIKFGGLLATESVDRYNHMLLASAEADAPPFAGREAR